MSSFRVTADERFLEVRFARPQQMLSWAIVGGGRTVSDCVVWHFVRREELPQEVDAVALLRERLRARGQANAVGLLTARHLRAFVHESRQRAGVRAECVATVGLGNALRTGDPAVVGPPAGTINVLCHVDVALSELAQLEAMALVVEARTAALLEHAHPSVVSGRAASGTGTDCCVMASPEGPEAAAYAGKHTLVGELVGAVVEAAVGRATRAWIAEQAGGAAGPELAPGQADG